MILTVQDRDDVSAVFVCDEDEETCLVDVNCNEALVRSMVERFNSFEDGGEVAFLMDRLSELNWSDDADQIYRDWCGHVEPALSRLRATMKGK